MSKNYKSLILSLLVGCAFASCHTGIENTKTITMTRQEKKELLPIAEELMMNGIVPAPLSSWKKGEKQFIISDNKGAIVFGLGNGESGNIAGDTIIYKGVSVKRSPGGVEMGVLHFSDKGRELRYDTGRSMAQAQTHLTGLDIPMVIDLDVVRTVDSLLRGRQVWILSDLRYSDSGERMKGDKFVPVEIERVVPGDAVFPLILKVKSGDEHFNVYMNLKYSGVESRTFGTLFSLTDPKLKYPNILPEVWKLIQEGKVRNGMTKEECRLSLGNPIEVTAGHNWSSTLDYWQYANGMFLRFEDGLLLMFRN